MQALTATLAEQMAKRAELDAVIRQNWKAGVRGVTGASAAMAALLS